MRIISDILESVDARLDEQEEIWILTLGGRAVALLDVVLGNVDTLSNIC